MKTRKRVVWGPFMGEFGWEVAQWAPFVNRHFREGDILRVKPGHRVLYGDFVHEDTYDADIPDVGGRAPDMLDPWISTAPKPHLHAPRGVPCINGELLPIPLHPAHPNPREHLALHCRGITKCQERNLPTASWDAVVKRLNDAGVIPLIIGSNEDYRPEGDVRDVRGASLFNLICWLRECRVLVGASSGPMHLAQACETPIIVWSGNARKDRPRYETEWNHFGSPAQWADWTWNPSPEAIYGNIFDAYLK